MHTIKEIERGLNDLKISAKTDIFPIINANKPEGGYFGVPRSVLSYVDFLGALYGGYGGETIGKTKRRNIATTRKAKTFLKDIFGEIYEPYREFGEIMYEMYRHGTVHLYRPNTLINEKGDILEWLTYKSGDKGERAGFTKYESKVIYVHHTIPQRFAYGRHIFPVSINLLYDDLLSAIDLYFDKLKKDKDLVKKYSEVIDALALPEKTDLF